jgi:DNA topoisomerase-1
MNPSVHSARAAGLRYVCDDKAGIRREMGPQGFKYVGPHGRVIRRPADLARIRALAIPPAWKDVWICPDPRGHLQATGRDARGRKQYRYHAHWRATRDETKFDRMQVFAAALPRIRRRTRADLRRPGLSREKVLATVVQLLEKSLIRVGNEEYAKTNGSFGLTTLRDKACGREGLDRSLRVSWQERQASQRGRQRSPPRTHRQGLSRPARAGSVSVHRR